MKKEIEVVLVYLNELKTIHQKEFQYAKKDGDRVRKKIALEKWKTVEAMSLWVRANINGEDIFKIN